jgi:hypothetical protein
MDLFGGDQREGIAQVKAELGTENGPSAHAGAVPAFSAMLPNIPQKVFVGFHKNGYGVSVSIKQHL